MSTDLAALYEQFPAVRGIVDDAQQGHVQAAEAINNLGLGGTSETSVRRLRKLLGRTTPVAGRLDENELASPYPDNNRPAPVRPKAPDGWVPGTVVSDTEVEIKTPFLPAEQLQDIRKLLSDAGLNPDEWSVPKVTTHQRYDEEGNSTVAAVWLRAVPLLVDIPSAEDINAILDRYQTHTREGLLDGNRILLVPSGDLQLGKSERGGTEATVDRFARYTNEIARDLVDSGEILDTLVLPWLGDCIEGIVSQRGKNIAMLDRTITEQVMIYWRLMHYQIAKLAPFARRVIVPVVPGNHDQTTREQIMPETDSWAIAGAAACADIIHGRSDFEHVEFIFPKTGEPHLAMEVGQGDKRLVLGFTHGHSTGNNPARIIEWLKGQSLGRQDVGHADILVTAHWHHLRAEFFGGGRTWFQIPAMDGGSGWYRFKTGDDVISGQITMDLTPGVGAGWNNLKVYN